MPDYLTANYHAKVTASRERYSKAIAEASVIWHDARAKSAAMREEKIRLANAEYDSQITQAMDFWNEKVSAFASEWQQEDVAAAIALEHEMEQRNRAYVSGPPPAKDKDPAPEQPPGPDEDRKVWSEKMALAEGDQEIGAGALAADPSFEDYVPSETRGAHPDQTGSGPD